MKLKALLATGLVALCVIVSGCSDSEETGGNEAE